MNRILYVGFAAVAMALGGCGGGDNQQVLDDAKGQNCGSTTYAAFAEANHADQDLRVAAQAKIAAIIEPAVDDLTMAPAAFAEVESIYESTADLRAKIQGRVDDHAPGDAAAQAVGQYIDEKITAAIARGKAAKAGTDVDIAMEVIDKNLTRFFYLSVYHELVEGERGTYDEAYGYLGTGPKNDPNGLQSIAKIARRRDDTNGTTYSQKLFDGIIAGSCAIDQAIAAAGGDSIDWKSDADYSAAVTNLDRLMLEVLATSAAHEFSEPLSALAPEEAKVRVYEGGYYFIAIEHAMLDMGGVPASDAQKIRAMLDAAMTAIDSGKEDWQAGFDAEFIRDAVSTAFGVQVKG